MRTRNTLVVEAALLAASLAAGIGALRLTTTPAAAHLVLAVVASVVSGHLTVSLVRRIGRERAPAGLALASGIAAVALVASWISVPLATFYGIPTARTPRALLDLFEQAWTLIRSHPTPLAPTPGVSLCLTCGAGIAAVVSRALFGSTAPMPERSVRPLLALVPSFGLFAYTAVLSSGVDRVTGAIAYVIAACVFLVATDLPTKPERATRPSAPGPRLLAVRTVGHPARVAPLGFRRRRDPGAVAHSVGGSAHARIRTGIGAGLASVATAGALALALSPSLSGMRLDALPFKGGPHAGSVRSAGSGTAGTGARGEGGSKSQGALGVVELIANLQGVLTSRSQQVMFDARSPVPVYWQVGTLSVFDGSEWRPDPATARSSAGAPPGPTAALPLLPEPSGSSTYSAQISLVALAGHLLPIPPDSVSVKGPGTTLDPAIGAIFGENEAAQASAGLTYEAVARTPHDPSAPSGLNDNATASSPPIAADLAPYLALPSGIPSGVTSLAQQITAGASGPAAKAQALAQWFDSGLFRYTLDPPPPVPGESPLISFLFVNRAGFCQQFAGAYAVLARSIGLPTRLAVGFATGVPVGNANKTTESSFGTTYRVTGADAHVWPEVYLGPQSGWVSFEPTPPASDEPSPVGVIEGSATPASTGAGPSTSTTQAGSSGARAGEARRGGASRADTLWPYLALAIACALAMVALAGAVVFLRRLLRRRLSLPARLRALLGRRPSRIGDANEQVLSGLDRASRELRRVGLGRRSTETLEEHVSRLRCHESAGALGSALGVYEELTRLAERASYAPDPCTEEDAATATRLCETLSESIRPSRSPAGR